MLSFFPQLYPDELLYSGLARYHIRSGNTSFRQTEIELFGYYSQQICRVILPSNLNYLVNNLPLRSKQTVENIIQNHSLYPFYATFLIPQEAWVVRESMKKKLNGSILEMAKVAFNSTDRAKKFLKFCPICMEEDMQKFGEGYWHRFHQIPGVMVCSVHNSALYDSSVIVETRNTHYHAASPDNCILNTNTRNYTEETLQKLIVLAREVEWLISNNMDFKGLAWLRSQYKHYLVNKKLITLFPGSKFIFKEKDFSKSIFNFYGQDFFETINQNCIKNPDKYFFNCLLACDINPVIDRIIHILIINFLANSLEKFFR
ncbi:MAG: TnsD family Tn7-like transposition protein [Nostoc sp. DedQUE08]|uniref:TnsD family Tn7-like transposition protein n=1 Tax=Nostoc sp. DedQUE08 TaxID=3075393 RepID=UPI002AD54B79|nr:TnsD family Tn7-like transposition protein [Nostoc sp. DedQUE08]MDZ8064920.1 TnsD family Tn7-like transposition protein [Nostoc sp. DedQUE08]